MTETAPRVLDAEEAAELEWLVRQAVRSEIAGLVGQMCGPGADLVAGAELAACCTFDHIATLVFPRHLAEVHTCLAAMGWRTTAPVPSVVVRQRLADRYGMSEGDLEVQIIRATKDGQPGLEVFCLPTTQAIEQVIAGERQHHNERHWALFVDRPDQALLERLAELLVGKLSMLPDGGGHNPHEERRAGGQTVLYFKYPSGRLELTCAGNFPGVLDRHTAPGETRETIHVLQ
jgi:hypothetical protein